MTNYDKAIFARNLNRYMRAAGTSQNDLAELLNVSKSTVSSWCNGQKMPRIDKIQRIADYYQIYKSDLIEDKGSEGLDAVSGIGQRIMEARQAKGLSQAELAQQLGEPVSQIVNYELDIRSPIADVLPKLLDILDVDANYLFQYTTNEKAPPTDPMEQLREGLETLLERPVSREQAEKLFQGMSLMLDAQDS